MIQFMVDEKYMILWILQEIHLKKCMIVTEEYNNESMRMNEDSMICENNKEFKFKRFSEQCFKLCSYKYRKSA